MTRPGRRKVREETGYQNRTRGLQGVECRFPRSRAGYTRWCFVLSTSRLKDRRRMNRRERPHTFARTAATREDDLHFSEIPERNTSARCRAERDELDPVRLIAFPVQCSALGGFRAFVGGARHASAARVGVQCVFHRIPDEMVVKRRRFDAGVSFRSFCLSGAEGEDRYADLSVRERSIELVLGSRPGESPKHPANGVE